MLSLDLVHLPAKPQTANPTPTVVLWAPSTPVFVERLVLISQLAAPALLAQAITHPSVFVTPASYPIFLAKLITRPRIPMATPWTVYCSRSSMRTTTTNSVILRRLTSQPLNGDL